MASSTNRFSVDGAADRRPLSEWAARWIVWLLVVTVVSIASAGISLGGAHACVRLVGRLTGQIDDRTGTVLALVMAAMCAPVPVVLVAYALAPARRWLTTAALLAAGMLFWGVPLDGFDWTLWIGIWLPSWIVLGILFRDGRTKKSDLPFGQGASSE